MTLSLLIAKGTGMPTIYLNVMETMADWEPAFLLAELVSGRFFRDRTVRYRVVPCGESRDPVFSMGGLRMVPEQEISAISPGQDDLLILPGGDRWLEPAQKKIMPVIGRILGEGVLVGAICGATMALADAGFLDTRRHTSNNLDVLVQLCPGYNGASCYVDERAVIDGNLVTASGMAPVDFAYQVMKKLGVMRENTLEAWYQLYTTGNAEHFHSLIGSLSD